MTSNKKRFIEDYDYRVYRIWHLSKKYGWKFLSDINGMIFSNKEVLLRIDPKNLTIETELTHPYKGQTKLLREGDFTMDMIEKIFKNPRTHTSKEINSTYLGC